jgi:hypothetical protein
MGHLVKTNPNEPNFARWAHPPLNGHVESGGRLMYNSLSGIEGFSNSPKVSCLGKDFG